MSDVKQLRRLKTAVAYEYSDQPGVPGVSTIRLSEHKDGGAFDLHPLVKQDGDTTTLLLPHVDSPQYALALSFDKDTAGRLGRALLGLERKANGGTDEEEG